MMKKPLIKTLLLFGTGLIGGSLALALKKAGAVQQVIGVDRDITSLERAKTLGIIDEIAPDLSDSIPRADLIVLATPVAQTQHVLATILPHLSVHTLVTDVGSVKGAVVSMAQAALGSRIGQFVPAHPIAGSEKSGPDAAADDLFVGKKLILTALPENTAEQKQLVTELWESTGALVSELTPAAHDQIFAAVSHLPQLLTYAFMNSLSDKENQQQLFAFAGTGFRDFTRLAGSSPEMWRDIAALNPAAIVADLDDYMAQLIRLRSLLVNGNVAQLQAYFASSQQAHQSYLSVTQTPQS